MDEQRDKWMNRYRWMDSKINRFVDMGVVYIVSGLVIKIFNVVFCCWCFCLIVNVMFIIMMNLD